MNTAYLSSENLYALKDLRSKIEDNQASVEDYQAYENILDDYYDIEEIQEPLKKAGIPNYDSLVEARKSDMDTEKYEKVEGFLVGALLGLGLGLILASMFSSNK